MQVTINDIANEVPFNLADIPLGKFIEYYDQYGRDLDKQLESIVKRDYAKELSANWSVDIDEVNDDDILLHRQMDIDDQLDNEAITWFSFWTGADLHVIEKDVEEIMPLLAEYKILKNLLIEDSNPARVFPVEIEWKGAIWSIQNYTVNPASEMVANEIFTSKEVMLQMHNLGLGRWPSLLYLCAVFFRKKGEAFNSEMVHEDSDRLKVMKDLPMEHALKVSFFLSVCVTTWKRTLVFLDEREAVIPSLN